MSGTANLAAVEEADQQARRRPSLLPPPEEQGKSRAGHPQTIPVYLHILNELTASITAGEFEPSGRLPAESELCARFGVSHMTLRKSLLILAERGLITTQQGRGTFVRYRTFRDTTFSVRQLLGGWLGSDATVRLLSAGTMRANPQVAEALELSLEDRVVYVRRVVARDDLVAAYLEEYVPSSMVTSPGELLREDTSIDRLFELPGGLRITRGHVTVEACVLRAPVARVLHLPNRTPALRLARLAVDERGRATNWACLYLPAGLFSFRFGLDVR
jgi:GntR family transcriptional regulator